MDKDDIHFLNQLKYSSLTIKRKKYLFLSQDKIEKFYFVQSGFIQIFFSNAEGHDVYLKTYPYGEWICLHEIFHKNKHSFSAIALTDSKIFAIDKKKGLNFLNENLTHQIFYHKQIEKDFHSYQRQCIQFIIEDRERRLKNLFQEWVRMFPKNKKNEIEIPFLKKDISKMIHTTPETLSRILTQWKKNEWIQFKGNHWMISESLFES